MVGSNAPLSLQNLAANTEVTLLNFWATWCAPCVAEIPALVDLAHSLAPRVRIIFVNIDLDKKTALSFLQRVLPQKKTQAVTWVWDQKKTLTEGIFGVYKLPETLIISPNLTVHKKIVGVVDWADAEVRHSLFP